MKEYQANAGQTYVPFQENIHIDTVPYEPLLKPDPEIQTLELNSMACEKGWMLQAQSQHFLPGVSAKMLDWFWANMEKGYYLWAPGSHKRFSWVKSPAQYGFLNSIHMISEAIGKDCPVFGGEGVEIHRLGLDYFPFTFALEHVLVEGVFNDKNEFVDMTVHMWEDDKEGCRHITASVASTTVSEPPRFIKEMLEKDPQTKPVAPSETDHCDYEASQWPVFLPKLYDLWKNHPDPSQNVSCDLSVRRIGNESWEYTHDNPAVIIK